MADAGRAMMLYRGLYDNTHTYEKLDVVNFNGSLYISTTDGNLGTEPTDVTKWKLFLQGGVSDNIQATDTYGLVGEAGENSFVQLLLDSLASRVGKDGNGNVIEDTYIPQNATLNTLEEIDANTSEENIAGALAVKEISKKMQNEMEASSNWVDITDSCNFGFVDLNSASVYMNSTLRLVSFSVAVNGNVNNQGTVFAVALLPSGSNPKILISSCNHTTDGVSVNLLTDGVTVKSSHSMDVSIANARYSGLIVF